MSVCQPRRVRSAERERLRGAGSARRVSRAALIGVGAVALACGTTAPVDDAGSDGAAADVQNDQSLMGADGGPPVDAGMDCNTGPDSPVAAYGGPPPK